MATDMDFVATNNDELLDELEVSETDAALLREILEELENEEATNDYHNHDETGGETCQVQLGAVEETIDNNVFHAEHVNVVHQQPHYESGWVEMVETNSLLPINNDMAISDWFEGIGGVVGFEVCSNVGDYSYVYNEMSYGCLWENDS